MEEEDCAVVEVEEGVMDGEEEQSPVPQSVADEEGPNTSGENQQHSPSQVSDQNGQEEIDGALVD